MDGIGLMRSAMSFERVTRAETVISPVVFTAVGAASGVGSEDEDLMMLLEVWIIQ